MKKEKIFWGLLFIFGGIILIVNNLGYFPGLNIIKLFLTAMLIAVIIKNVWKMEFAGILFPIALICILYDNELGITAVTPWTVLIAALFGSIGLSLIFGSRKKHAHIHHEWDEGEFERFDTEDSSRVQHVTTFGSSMKYVNTDKFTQADLKCTFGAMKVFFENTQMLGEEAVVDLDVTFGGVELYIPRNWNVVDKTNVSFGSMEEKNKSDKVSTNTLILYGNISFAGVEIIYV